MGETRVFVIGLDGGTWDIIRPLIGKGQLPNIKSLMENSCWGTLRSTFPASTCPAWFTFSTGMKPSHIGIYNFQAMYERSNRLKYCHYGNLEHVEFWDILMKQGISCGIINHPMLFHRKSHYGYIVPGSIIPEQEYRTFPEELMGNMVKAIGGYEIDQKGLYFIDDQTLLSGCLDIERKRTKAMSYLINEQPTDFFLGVYTIPDRACHRFLTRASLGEGEEREAGWRALEESYGEVDRGIGHLMSLMEEDDFLLVISDHGFKAKPWNIYINQFLMDQGLLALDIGGALEKTGLTQRNLGMLLSKLGIKTKWMDRLYQLAPGFVRKLLPTGKTIYGEYMISEMIERGKLDWSRTKAVFLGSGIYLNTDDRPEGIVPPGDVEKVKRQIKEGLERLRSPDGNPSPVRAVEPEVMYGGGELINPPDLLITGDDVWEIEITIPEDQALFSPNERAGHSRDGMFILRHPWVNPGELAQPLEMEDIAPLILHIFRQPVPEDMDGRVRLDLFQPDADICREPRYTYAGPIMSEEQRLKRKVARLKEAGLL
jgi:predicted AlkP superfamily phosphohydrolase/phosphomutase